MGAVKPICKYVTRNLYSCPSLSLSVSTCPLCLSHFPKRPKATLQTVWRSIWTASPALLVWDSYLKFGPRAEEVVSQSVLHESLAGQRNQPTGLTARPQDGLGGTTSSADRPHMTHSNEGAQLWWNCTQPHPLTRYLHAWAVTLITQWWLCSSGINWVRSFSWFWQSLPFKWMENKLFHMNKRMSFSV